jgi:hypothetical protein
MSEWVSAWVSKWQPERSFLGGIFNFLILWLRHTFVSIVSILWYNWSPIGVIFSWSKLFLKWQILILGDVIILFLSREIIKHTYIFLIIFPYNFPLKLFIFYYFLKILSALFLKWPSFLLRTIARYYYNIFIFKHIYSIFSHIFVFLFHFISFFYFYFFTHMYVIVMVVLRCVLRNSVSAAGL